MKLFPRYRRPAVGEVVGTTQAKRRLTRRYHLRALDAPYQVGLARRRVLRHAGYYSPLLVFLRFLLRVLP